MRAVAHGQAVRDQVGGDQGAGSEKRALTDAYALMHGTVARDTRAVADVHVARKSSRRGKDDIASEDAVVRNVAHGHDEAAVSDRCEPTASCSATAQKSILAYAAPLADDERRWFACKFEVLRLSAKRCECVYDRISANACVPMDAYMRVQPHTIAKGGLTTHNAVWADVHSCS